MAQLVVEHLHGMQYIYIYICHGFESCLIVFSPVFSVVAFHRLVSMTEHRLVSMTEITCLNLFLVKSTPVCEYSLSLVSMLLGFSLHSNSPFSFMLCSLSSLPPSLLPPSSPPPLLPPPSFPPLQLLIIFVQERFSTFLQFYHSNKEIVDSFG